MNDATIVRAAVKHDGRMLLYASEEIKNDAAILQAAADQNYVSGRTWKLILNLGYLI